MVPLNIHLLLRNSQKKYSLTEFDLAEIEKVLFLENFLKTCFCIGVFFLGFFFSICFFLSKLFSNE